MDRSPDVKKQEMTDLRDLDRSVSLHVFELVSKLVQEHHNKSNAS